jgi:hypothetical protein
MLRSPCVQTLYSRLSKVIPSDESERLFNLAVKDYNQAVALNPPMQRFTSTGRRRITIGAVFRCESLSLRTHWVLVVMR